MVDTQARECCFPARVVIIQIDEKSNVALSRPCNVSRRIGAPRIDEVKMIAKLLADSVMKNGEYLELSKHKFCGFRDFEPEGKP